MKSVLFQEQLPLHSSSIVAGGEDPHHILYTVSAIQQILIVIKSSITTPCNCIKKLISNWETNNFF